MTKIGDIIRAGDPIPPDVVGMTDVQAMPGEYWKRIRTDPLEYAYDGGALRTAVDIELHSEWFPMTVTEVDGTAVNRYERATDAYGTVYRMHMPCRRVMIESRSACRYCDEVGEWRSLFVVAEQ